MKKAVILLKNSQERQAIKPFFSEFDDALFPKTAEEFREILQIVTDVPELIVLDEQCGDTYSILENLSVVFAQKSPVILIFIEQREDTKAAWNSETERLELYAGLGVELFLHRPCGLFDIKEKIAEACSWAKVLPAWVQLVRASRTLIKHQQSDRILLGLETMFKQKPGDLSLGLLFIRAQRSSKNPDPEKIYQTLLVLNETHKDCPPVMKLLAQELDRRQDIEKAAEVYIRLCQIDYSSNNLEQLCSYFKLRPSAAKLDIRFWRQSLILVSGAEHRWEAFCLICFEHLAQESKTLEEIEIFIDVLKKFDNFPGDLTPFLKQALGSLDKLYLKSEGDALWNRHETPALFLMESILDREVSNPEILIRFTQSCLQFNNCAKAEGRLRRARLAGSLSLEYHVAMAWVHIAQVDLIGAKSFLANGQALIQSTKQPLPQQLQLMKLLKEGVEKLQNSVTGEGVEVPSIKSVKIA